jgi:NADPH:quinone reductase-like Zn-dependent oxidoreductase
VHDLGANTIVDFQTHRSEEQVRDVDAVIDLVRGETQQRSYQVLRRGGKVISAVVLPYKFFELLTVLPVSCKLLKVQVTSCLTRRG